MIRDDVPHDPQGQANADALARALALIDQQEEALRAADALVAWILDDGPPRLGYNTRQRASAYRSARATSTKEDG